MAEGAEKGEVVMVQEAEGVVEKGWEEKEEVGRGREEEVELFGLPAWRGRLSKNQ